MSRAKQAWLKLAAWWWKQGNGDISQEQNGRGLAGQKMCLESEHGQLTERLPALSLSLSLDIISMWHKWHLVQKNDLIHTFNASAITSHTEQRERLHEQKLNINCLCACPRKLSVREDSSADNTEHKESCMRKSDAAGSHLFQTHQIVISVAFISRWLSELRLSISSLLYHSPHFHSSSPAGRSSSERILRTHPSWPFLWRHCGPRICRPGLQGATVLSLLALHHLNHRKPVKQTVKIQKWHHDDPVC